MVALTTLAFVAYRFGALAFNLEKIWRTRVNIKGFICVLCSNKSAFLFFQKLIVVVTGYFTNLTYFCFLFIGIGECGTCGAGCFILELLTGCGFVLTCLQRSALRKAYGIQGSEVGDCCAHFWCMCCALSQEAREIKTRGRAVK